MRSSFFKNRKVSLSMYNILPKFRVKPKIGLELKNGWETGLFFNRFNYTARISYGQYICRNIFSHYAAGSDNRIIADGDSG